MGSARRLVAGAVMATVVLTGCGSNDQKSADTGVGDTEVATGGRLFSTADEATAKLGSDAQPGVFPRTVKHALGETKLEKKPERVVVLDSGELDDVLALGITPVGMATNSGQTGVPSYLADKAHGIKTVGNVSELNIEAIAALKPDLILGSKLRANDLYAELSAIAPTVFSIRPGFPWKEDFLLVSEALGEETKATAVLNDYQKRATEVKGRISGSPTISLVRFRPGEIRLYGNLSFIGVILKDIGLPRPKVQDVQDLAGRSGRHCPRSRPARSPGSTTRSGSSASARSARWPRWTTWRSCSAARASVLTRRPRAAVRGRRRPPWRRRSRSAPWGSRSSPRRG
jgi:iron complex transport system substrate-binding protein